MTWIPVAESAANQHTIRIQFTPQFQQSIPILTYGTATLLLEPGASDQARVVIEQPGADDHSLAVPLLARRSPIHPRGR